MLIFVALTGFFLYFSEAFHFLPYMYVIGYFFVLNKAPHELVLILLFFGVLPFLLSALFVAGDLTEIFGFAYWTFPLVLLFIFFSASNVVLNYQRSADKKVFKVWEHALVWGSDFFMIILFFLKIFIS